MDTAYSSILTSMSMQTLMIQKYDFSIFLSPTVAKKCEKRLEKMNMGDKSVCVGTADLFFLYRKF